MNIVWLSLFGILIFLAVLLGGKKYRSTALYALAIGGAVNANFFTALTHPIEVARRTFGIDGILYTLFIFCVIVMLFEQGKKQAYLLSASSVIAIMLSAIFELVANILGNGYSHGLWDRFLDFTVSCVASILVIIPIIELIDLMMRKRWVLNKYILLHMGLVIATLINSPIYYTLASLFANKTGDLLELTLTSWMTKGLAIIFAMIAFFFMNLFDKKMKEREEKAKN